jgi:hypothetical protein
VTFVLGMLFGAILMLLLVLAFALTHSGKDR